MSPPELAPLFKSGPFANVPASDVPLAKIENMLTMPDLHPGTRAKLEQELRRRGLSTGSSDALVARRPRAATAAKTDTSITVTCPQCGNTLSATITLADVPDDSVPF